MKDFKFAEMCPYVTVTNTAIYPFAVVMNLNSWNALPQDVQKVMVELIREQSEWTGDYMDSHVKESVQWSKKTHQVEFIELSAKEKTKWDQRLQPLKDKWIADAKAKGLPAEAIIADIQASISKYSK